MTLLYASPEFQQHLTGSLPEHPQRLRAIDAQLARSGLLPRCQQPAWQPATSAELERVHDPHYVEHLQRYAAAGGGRIEAETVLSERSYEVARLAAGAACDAVRRVVRGEDQTALCLSRPPGHHARPHDAMGFCLFNNVAVAAHAALAEQQHDRVLVVDWDVHHGNGTQDEFYEDEQVGFLSIHRYPFYPGTGAADETGRGRGLGTTVNVPVKFGTPLARFFELFQAGLEKISSRIKPQLVLVSAGFDAHKDDPIGSLELETDDFIELTKRVAAVADEHAGGKMVCLLEGGYNLEKLADSVAVHLRTLLERK